MSVGMISFHLAQCGLSEMQLVIISSCVARRPSTATVQDSYRSEKKPLTAEIAGKNAKVAEKLPASAFSAGFLCALCG